MKHTSDAASDRQTERVDRRAFVRKTATALAAGVGLSGATAGVAAANENGTPPCFPSKLDVEVKPGEGARRDPINPRSDGVVPVAVLQTESFDPTARSVDYRFDAAGEVGCHSAQPLHGGHVADVDGDGNDDLVLHFPVEETNFERGDRTAELLWVKTQGERGRGTGTCTCRGLSGTDGVRIVGAGGRSSRGKP